MSADRLDLDAILAAADPTTPAAWTQKMRDQAFVLHAREDVPDLVAEVRRLRANNAALMEGCAELNTEVHDLEDELNALRRGSTGPTQVHVAAGDPGAFRDALASIPQWRRDR